MNTPPDSFKNTLHVPRILRFVAAGLLALALARAANAQTYTLSNTWAQLNVSGGDATNNLDTPSSADNRGLCYGAVSNQVLVNNKGTHIITSYDGTSGVSNGVVNVTGVTGGNFTINKLGFGTDGILYGANLTTSIAAGAYKLYSWTNETAAPYNCYSASGTDSAGVNLSGKRAGDTFAITGGGTNTMMLAGVLSGTTEINDFILFTTPDGTNFIPSVLTITNYSGGFSGGVQYGISFYTNSSNGISFIWAPAQKNVSYLVQVPANPASFGTTVISAGIVSTNTTIANGSWISYSYDAEAGLLAAHADATTNIYLYGLSTNNFASGALLANGGLSFATSTSINGNEAGDIALGGPGLTNMIYTLDTSAGVQATAILFAAAALPPSITTAPVGATVYTNAGSYSFSVTAQGTPPLMYLWQYNTVSNQATATDIPGATNSTFTINSLTTNNSGWYDVIVSNSGGVVTSAPMELTVLNPASSTAVTPLWTIPPGSNGYPYLDSSSYDTRGLAYDPHTMTVLIADKAPVNLYVLDANTGSNLFTMNAVGVGEAGDIFDLDQVGVADDGVVYGCDVVAAGSGSSFDLYQWTSVSTNATPAYAMTGTDPGNGSGDRWGDTLAVRGSGTSTEILLGSYDGYEGGPSTNAALLTTTDGQNFTPTVLTITNSGGIPAGFCSLGIAFGASNTFWAKSPGYDLYQIAFDPATGHCNILQDIATDQADSPGFNSMSSISLDVTNNLLAGVTFNDIPNDLALFQLGATTNTLPYLFDQAFFPSLNGNAQDNGVTTMKYPRIYGLDVNNGVVALQYSVPSAPPLGNYSISSVANVPGTGVVITVQTVSGHSYQLQYEGALSKPNHWTDIGSPVTASGASLSFTNSASGAAGFYRVTGQ